MKGLEDDDEVKEENVIRGGKEAEAARVPPGDTKEYIDIEDLERRIGVDRPPPTEFEKNLSKKDRRV